MNWIIYASGVVLGSSSVSGRDLLYFNQSSEDDLILDLSFRLLREYISRSDDVEFLDTLSLYFQNQDTSFEI